MILSGRVWKFGNGIGSTDLVSAKYDKQGMSRKWAECASHLLEDFDASFAAKIRPGEMLVAGDDFGAGHAHYHMTAIMSCKTAGLSGLFANSISGLFQRAAIDQGLPTWSIRGLGELVSTGDHLEVDLANGLASNLTSRGTLQFKPVPDLILDILGAGGSLNWALRRVGAEHAMT